MYLELAMLVVGAAVFYGLVVPLLFPSVTGRKPVKVKGADESIVQRTSDLPAMPLFTGGGETRSHLRARRRQVHAVSKNDFS